MMLASRSVGCVVQHYTLRSITDAQVQMNNRHRLRLCFRYISIKNKADGYLGDGIMKISCTLSSDKVFPLKQHTNPSLRWCNLNNFIPKAGKVCWTEVNLSTGLFCYKSSSCCVIRSQLQVP